MSDFAPYSRQVDMHCVGCKTKIERIDHLSGPCPADEDMWDDGLVHTVVAGFGSKHDASHFLIGICDNCIDKFVADGSLIEYFNQFDGSLIKQNPTDDELLEMARQKNPALQ